MFKTNSYAFTKYVTFETNIGYLFYSQSNQNHRVLSLADQVNSRIRTFIIGFHLKMFTLPHNLRIQIVM